MDNAAPANPASGSDIVIAHDDYIEIIWDGPQNADTVRRSNVDTQTAAQVFQKDGKSILAMLHIQHQPQMPDIGAFEEVLKIFQAVEFNRLAIAGTIPPSLMALVTTIIGSFEREFDIKYFMQPQEALVWLRDSGE